MRDILKTERLTLRTLELADAPRFSEYANDWDIARMTSSVPHPFPLVSTEVKIMTMLSKRRRGLAYPYAITLDGGDFMGIMDIFRRNKDADFELGYWVARRYWNNGYAPEAAIALLKEAVMSLGLKKIIAGVYADNPASMRVLEKIGFYKTGIDGDFFSMARLADMMSIGFEMDWDAITTAGLHGDAQSVIEAT